MNRVCPSLPHRSRGMRNVIPILVAVLVAVGVLFLAYNYGTFSATSAASGNSITGVVDSPQSDPDELRMLRARSPDYSGPAQLAISISWPLYAEGKKAHPMAYTGIRGDDGETAAVLPSYAEARLRAANQQKWSGKERGILQADRGFGNCSNFVSTIVINTLVPEFPTLAGEIHTWVTNPENGWQLVGTSETYEPSSYLPGDIFVTRAKGHTFMWIGEYGGYPDVVAEASFSSDERTRTGVLRRYGLNPQTGEDRSGRLYDVWRYLG